MSPQRVIRPAARRSPAGAGSLLWTAAAAALPVIVTVLVLVALTLGVLLFSSTGFDTLVPVVAVEWLVVNRVPLVVDAVELGFLPLLPPLLYVALLARQTRSVLADVEQPGAAEAGAAVAGVTVSGLVLTGIASLLMGSATSDFAVRELSLPAALLWTAVVGLIGSGFGVWLFFHRDLRESLPVWVRGGIHLGVAFVASIWAIASLLVLVGILFAWEPIGAVMEIGRSFTGTAALTGISVGYLPNVVLAGAALLVGSEAHLGEASYSVFAVSRGPMPEVPLAAALPTTNPHWIVQGLLLVTVLVAAALARYVAPWFRTTADGVRAAWLGALIVALVMAVTPLAAGGTLGVLGQVGTGWLIAAVMSLLLFGIIGSATVALSLAGLTRRRERAESELARRRRRAGRDAAPSGNPADLDDPDLDDPEDDRVDDDDEAGVELDDVDVPTRGEALSEGDVAPHEWRRRRRAGSALRTPGDDADASRPPAGGADGGADGDAARGVEAGPDENAPEDSPEDPVVDAVADDLPSGGPGTGGTGADPLTTGDSAADESDSAVAPSGDTEPDLPAIDPAASDLPAADLTAADLTAADLTATDDDEEVGPAGSDDDVTSGAGVTETGGTGSTGESDTAG